MFFKIYLREKQCKCSWITSYLDEELNNYIIPGMSVLCGYTKTKPIEIFSQ